MEKSIGRSNKAKISRILGIDYGRSKVGLAVCDWETKIAFVFGMLKNDKNFLQNLWKIMQEENISRVVIGIPSHVNRKETVYDGEKLGEAIKNSLPYVEVEYQDEMFTTKMAQDNLIERGVKKVKKHDDEEAARIILQSWLDYHI